MQTLEDLHEFYVRISTEVDQDELTGQRHGTRGSVDLLPGDAQFLAPNVHGPLMIPGVGSAPAGAMYKAPGAPFMPIHHGAPPQVPLQGPPPSTAVPDPSAVEGGKNRKVGKDGKPAKDGKDGGAKKAKAKAELVIPLIMENPCESGLEWYNACAAECEKAHSTKRHQGPVSWKGMTSPLV